MNEQLTRTKPYDRYLHVRDGEKLQRVVLDGARSFGKAMIMPTAASSP